MERNCRNVVLEPLSDIECSGDVSSSCPPPSYFRNLVVEYVVKIADDIIHADPTQCLLPATEDAHDDESERGGITVATVEAAAAAAAVDDDDVADSAARVDGTTNGILLLEAVVVVLATMRPMPDKIRDDDDDGGSENAIMRSPIV